MNKLSREQFEEWAYLPRNQFFAAALMVGMTGGSQKEVWKELEPKIIDIEREDWPDKDFPKWLIEAVGILHDNINVRHFDWTRKIQSVRAFGNRVCQFPLPPFRGWPAPPGILVFEGDGIVSVHPERGLGEDDFAAPYTPDEGSERTGPVINWKEQN